MTHNEHLNPLRLTWGAEYDALTRTAQAALQEDYEQAVAEDQISAVEYRRRIGRGNLASYCDCLLAK